MNDNVITWLLEDNNPAVKYRTQTEILGVAGDKEPVVEWLNNFLPDDWKAKKWITAAYYLNAFAECGLTIEDVPIKKENLFTYNNIACISRHGCGDFLSLRSFICFGLGNDPLISDVIKNLSQRQLPDGGFLCDTQLSKLKRTPKSCYKANLYALMLCAECKKRNIEIPIEESVLDYFWNHSLFYRTDNPDSLVLNGREGWRSIDTFYPFEAMRVGIQNIVESLCALGHGSDSRLNEAWDILNSKKNSEGKYVLDGTLTKPYLPKERVGKPSKWITFYALLAEKEKSKRIK